MKSTRRWSVLAAALLLSGCNSTSESAYGQYWQILRQAWTNTTGDGRISRQQAASVAYASLGFRMHDNPEAMLVLATDTGGEQMWTSASHVVLMTNGGRVIRTQGLAHNLGAVATTSNQVPSPFAALHGSVTYQRLQDFPDLGIYGAALACRLSAVGGQTIQILGSDIRTIQIREKCDAEKSLNWSFTDIFWIAPDTGFVWRSIQHIHPRLGQLEIEIFRPPS